MWKNLLDMSCQAATAEDLHGRKKLISYPTVAFKPIITSHCADAISNVVQKASAARSVCRVWFVILDRQQHMLTLLVVRQQV